MKKHVAVIFGLGILLSSVIAAKADSSFSKDLYFGMQKDSEVTKLQEFLSSEGLYSGSITGNYFSLTMKAVVAFQKREGVNASGYFGPKSRAKADVILGSQIQASEAQAIAETGSTTTTPIPPKTTNDVANTLQSQLDALIKQVGLLQDQLKTQQQTQTSIQTLQTQVAQQGQTLQQIQQNTAPTPAPQPILSPVPSGPAASVISIQNQVCNLSQTNLKADYYLTDLLQNSNTNGRIIMNAYVLDQNGQNYYTNNPSAVMMITTSNHSNDKTLNGSGNVSPCGYYYPYEFYATQAGTYAITYSVPSLNLSKLITLNVK